MPRKLRLQYSGAIYHVMRRTAQSAGTVRILPLEQLRSVLETTGQRWKWLRVDRLLGEWGIAKDSAAGRRRFGQVMEHRRQQESPETDWKAIERGWCLASEEFKAELLAQVGQLRGDHYGEELRQADQPTRWPSCKRNSRRAAGTIPSWPSAARATPKRWASLGVCARRRA